MSGPRRPASFIKPPPEWFEARQSVPAPLPGRPPPRAVPDVELIQGPDGVTDDADLTLPPATDMTAEDERAVRHARGPAPPTGPKTPGTETTFPRVRPPTITTAPATPLAGLQGLEGLKGPPTLAKNPQKVPREGNRTPETGPESPKAPNAQDDLVGDSEDDSSQVAQTSYSDTLIEAVLVEGGLTHREVRHVMKRLAELTS